jgi:hypothetical protein
MGKLLVVLVAVSVITIAVVIVSGWIAGRADDRRRRNAKWVPVPHTDEDNNVTIAIQRGDQKELVWPTDTTRDMTYDMAMIEAESRAMEYNRMQRELTR